MRKTFIPNSAWYWKAVAADARRDGKASRRDPDAMAVDYARWLATRDGVTIPADAKAHPLRYGNRWTYAVEFTLQATARVNAGSKHYPLWVNRHVPDFAVTVLIPHSDYNPVATDISDERQAA